MPTTLAAVSVSTRAEALREHTDAIYAGGTATGRGGRSFPLFPVGLTREAGLVLSDLVTAERGRITDCARSFRTIETGMAFGLSTLFILQGAFRGGPDESVVDHTAIDPYQERDWDRAGEVHLERAGVRGLVRLIEEDSSLALPALLRDHTPAFDLAFADGGHRFENVFADCLYLSRLLRPGGLLILDDLWMPSVRAAAAYFTLNMGLSEVPMTSLMGEHAASKRFLALRTPTTPPKLAWDAFVPFSA